MVQIITKYDIMKNKQIRIDGGIYYDRRDRFKFCVNYKN